MSAMTLLLMCGCTGQPAAQPPRTPSPTATPVFASDEEALAAAEKAYTAFIAVSDASFQAGGFDTSAGSSVSEGAALQSFEADAAQLRTSSERITGPRSLRNFTLQSRSTREVRFYVCEDISGVTLVAADGTNLTTPDRPDQQAFEGVFDAQSKLISERNIWPSEGIC